MLKISRPTVWWSCLCRRAWPTRSIFSLFCHMLSIRMHIIVFFSPHSSKWISMQLCPWSLLYHSHGAYLKRWIILSLKLFLFLILFFFVFVTNAVMLNVIRTMIFEFHFIRMIKYALKGPFKTFCISASLTHLKNCKERRERAQEGHRASMEQL